MPDQAVSRAYDMRVTARLLREDAAQRRALPELDRLANRLSAPQSAGLLSRAIKRILRHETEGRGPGGIYLVGKVGRGKTMLMDLFFEQVSLSRKRRIHFSAFMQDLHGRIHARRKSVSAADAVAPVARAIGKDARLLCLDEFQVRDIADAMLLGRLFEALISQGVGLVLTSNTEPDFLYENGLNRQLFVPFITMIKERLKIVPLDGATDYRLNTIAGEKVYVSPLSPAADRHLAKLWRGLTDSDEGTPAEIRIQKRSVRVPQAARGVARFTFADLCETPLGPADYLAIARNFDTVFIEQTPVLSRERPDIARRFITAIDIFHDSKLRVVMSAAAPPAELGPEIEEFDRTVSRLTEMQDPAYAEKYLSNRSST